MAEQLEAIGIGQNSLPKFLGGVWRHDVDSWIDGRRLFEASSVQSEERIGLKPPPVAPRDPGRLNRKLRPQQAASSATSNNRDEDQPAAAGNDPVVEAEKERMCPRRDWKRKTDVMHARHRRKRDKECSLRCKNNARRSMCNTPT